MCPSEMGKAYLRVLAALSMPLASSQGGAGIERVVRFLTAPTVHGNGTEKHFIFGVSIFGVRSEWHEVKHFSDSNGSGGTPLRIHAGVR